MIFSRVVKCQSNSFLQHFFQRGMNDIHRKDIEYSRHLQLFLDFQREKQRMLVACFLRLSCNGYCCLDQFDSKIHKSLDQTKAKYRNEYFFLLLSRLTLLQAVAARWISCLHAVRPQHQMGGRAGWEDSPLF